MKKIVFSSLIFLVLLSSQALRAQSILQSADLSTIKVENLSQAEIEKIKSEITKNGLSIDAAEQLALQKGMSSSQFAVLKNRLNTSSEEVNSLNLTDPATNGTLSAQKVENTKIKDKNSIVFGSQLFDNPTLNFEPNLQLATPVNYILGPGDELKLSVYGVQEYSGNLRVSNEGFLSVPSAGNISVSGLTIEAASVKVERALSRIYSTLSSGQSTLSLTLSRIRTIQVTIIGARQPGNYSVSSLSTVYNALFLSGGPSKNGSYRQIELIRNNEVVETIDLYQFLISGDQTDNVGLKDNDVIRIPTYRTRVALQGEVKRPGIFEVINNERFDDVLKYASGFTENAYTASINVIRKTSTELAVYDLKQDEFKTYTPTSGEEFKVTKILDRYSNRVTIDGAVFRPNTYAYSPGLTIADLVQKAEGLTEDAYTRRARVLRLDNNLKLNVINIDLDKALAGDSAQNIELNREDIVTVYSILDFSEELSVQIGGEINLPGTYDYYPGLTLNDLLLQAGGLAGSASKRIEIARMLVADQFDNDLTQAELFDVEITPSNNEQAQNFELKPFDVVNIRKMPVYDKPKNVRVRGAVLYPGSYTLVNKKERISDVILRSGGLTTAADIRGVRIKRPILQSELEAVASIDENLGVNDSINDGIKGSMRGDKYATIPVDWEEIIKNPNSNTNVTLLPGDEIEVATYREGVKIGGNVILTSEIPYEKGKSFRYYIDAVGGTNKDGWKRKSYIIYPNGQAKVAKSFLFFRNYPRVLPGSQIIVPEKPERTFDTTAIASFAGILVSLAGVVIAVLR